MGLFSKSSSATTNVTNTDNTTVGADNGSISARESTITLNEENNYSDFGAINAAFSFADGAVNSLGAGIAGAVDSVSSVLVGAGSTLENSVDDVLDFGGDTVSESFSFGSESVEFAGETQTNFIDGVVDIVGQLFEFSSESQQLNNQLAVEGFNIAGQTVVGGNFSTTSTQKNIVNTAMIAAAVVAGVALISRFKK